jgi:hypothetical protein
MTAYGDLQTKLVIPPEQQSLGDLGMPPSHLLNFLASYYYSTIDG